MKIVATSIAGLLVTSLVAQTSALDPLSDEQQQEFEMQKQQLKQKVLSWRQSDPGQYAQDHGLVPAELEVDQLNSNEVSEEELERFYRSKLNIEEAKRENPQAIFSLDTPFSMMTNDEFAEFVGDGDFDALDGQLPMDFAPTVERQANVPVVKDSKDWTESGCVAPVKQQGRCGSCWAFAGVTVLESAYCLANNRTFSSFSEQEVISCDYDNSACQGGLAMNALRYFQEKKSICTSSTYPYTSGLTQQKEECARYLCDTVPISLEVAHPEPTETSFLEVLKTQPIAVAVAAMNPIWKQYKGGILTSCPTETNHDVVVVGYGTSPQGLPYYKVQNSWGSQWGDKGFIYLSRQGSTCGILNAKAVYPKLN